MRFEVHAAAEEELATLRKRSVPEYVAMLHAIRKLRALRLELGYPHTSQVKGTDMRELRPRAGNSPWRAIYRRVGETLLLLAIGPEANVDPRGFDAALRRAASRLDD